MAGHQGLVGSAICRHLRLAGYSNLVVRTREAIDLRESAAVYQFFEAERPEYVFLAAARVGGISANNSRPAEFIHDNLAVQVNVIDAAYRSGVTGFRAISLMPTNLYGPLSHLRVVSNETAVRASGLMAGAA